MQSTLPQPLGAPAPDGWPWSGPVASTAPQSANWPTISVVTPSFNQGQFLEAAMRSVLLQGYPNLEYIVLDGGSTDQSVPVIEHYASHLAHWHSAPDDGQSDAIARGFERASGDVLCWLNSDDLLLPGALWHVAEMFRQREPTHFV